MLAGAQAVQVGTATFTNPAAIVEIQDQLLAYASSRGLHSVCELSSAGIAPL
jgi:dihydroorotate dehydrogenase